MSSTWILAEKDLRLLARDRRVLVLLLVMPFVFILILGLSLGEGFFKPDNRLQISFVDLDGGEYDRSAGFPPKPWSHVVQDDLRETAGIRLDPVQSREEAVQLVRGGQRSAVLVFGPHFSERVSRCSFLAEGINPFYRDGVKLTSREAGQPAVPPGPDELDVELLIDPTQRTGASIIEQVAQVSLLRVVMPWMIGRAFEKIGDVSFIERLGTNVQVSTLIGKQRPIAALNQGQKKEVGEGVQKSLQELFSKYNLTGKTWADLTRSGPRSGEEQRPTLTSAETRYQILVPSYTVMFAFFLVLTVGWLFVGERRSGTLKRLRASPLTRTNIVLGKMIPIYLLSLAQGFFLLGAGRIVFGMSWGPQPSWLIPVVLTTSLAAMGLSMFVAALAQTETQVSIYGTLLVLVLAGVSGCLMPRDLMPETMKRISRVTPHAWALDAYNQLLNNPDPNLAIVGQACFVLAGFGATFVVLAWLFLRLD